ncbi:MAG: ATP-binding cassette domain-containing protein, partial [Rubrivivax sp.]
MNAPAPLVALTPAVSPTTAHAADPSTRPLLLQAEGITKRFGTHEVLQGVSVRARRGDVISMIGSSGSGKSTFLRCLNLLEQP